MAQEVTATADALGVLSQEQVALLGAVNNMGAPSDIFWGMVCKMFERVVS